MPYNAAAVVELTPARRPETARNEAFRGSGDLTRRNLSDRRLQRVVGGWSPKIADGELPAARPSVEGPQSIKQPPEPTRRWSAARRRLGYGAPAWSPAPAQTPGKPSSLPVGGWSARLSGNGASFTQVREPQAAMANALQGGRPQGFSRRRGLGEPISWRPGVSESSLQAVIAATYRQLLNRMPLAAERLGDAESQLRDGRISLSEFVRIVASSDLFQQRLNRMAPLRAASAAYLALMGRAGQPKEVSEFLAVRGKQGQISALSALLTSEEYASRFGRDTVPYLWGLNTEDGIPLATVNRTAALYAGNAGLTPPTRDPI